LWTSPVSGPYETLYELKLEKHPDKKAMGRTERGFDFLGFHFGIEGISVAKNTIERFLTNAVRLYEQEQREPCDSPLLGICSKISSPSVTAGM
jgi:hypothetical protein